MKKLGNGLNLLWPTPIYKTKISEKECETLFNLFMTNQILKSSDNDTNMDLIKKSNDLKRIAHSKFKEFFKQAYNEDIEKYNTVYKAWITGTNSGYSMETHNHAGSPFVAVFYILSEPDDMGGELVLTDPRTNANRGYRGNFLKQFSPMEFKPETGDVIIFPGFVYHHVKTYHSKLRVAIPVDLFFYNNDYINNQNN